VASYQLECVHWRGWEGLFKSFWGGGDRLIINATKLWWTFAIWKQIKLVSRQCEAISFGKGRYCICNNIPSVVAIRLWQTLVRENQIRLHVIYCRCYTVGVTNSVHVPILFFFSLFFRDAKLFNIAVDAEKKKQLELELQVLFCSLLVLWFPWDILLFFVELFCFIVTVLFLSRITDVKIQLLNNFTGHQSSNTTKIRRVQTFEWEGEVLAEGIRSNENWKGLSLCRLAHLQFVLGRWSFVRNFCSLLKTYGAIIKGKFIHKWLQMVHHTGYLVPHDMSQNIVLYPIKLVEYNLAHVLTTHLNSTNLCLILFQFVSVLSENLIA